MKVMISFNILVCPHYLLNGRCENPSTTIKMETFPKVIKTLLDIIVSCYHKLFLSLSKRTFMTNCAMLEDTKTYFTTRRKNFNLKDASIALLRRMPRVKETVVYISLFISVTNSFKNAQKQFQFYRCMQCHGSRLSNTTTRAFAISHITFNYFSVIQASA